MTGIQFRLRSPFVSAQGEEGLHAERESRHAHPSTPLRVKRERVFFMPSGDEALHRTPYGGAETRHPAALNLRID